MRLMSAMPRTWLVVALRAVSVDGAGTLGCGVGDAVGGGDERLPQLGGVHGRERLLGQLWPTQHIRLGED